MSELLLIAVFAAGALVGWTWTSSRWHFHMARKLREFRESDFDPEVWVKP